MLPRALLILAGLLVATPARAQLCDVFYQPLTQEQAERYAAEVKDGYPARYRATLDAVKLTLTDDLVHNITLVQGSRGDEMVIPALYLKTHCLLAIGASAFGDYAAEEIASGREPDLGELPQCPGKSQLACLLDALDKGVNQSADKARGELLAPSRRVLIESAFKYAIAHEYGHAIADATGDASARPRDYDAELEADMFALHPVAANRIQLAADSILFGSQVLGDAVEAREPAADAPHEPTICRAQRSNAMRARLFPPLMRIAAWTFSDSPLGVAIKRFAEDGIPEFLFAPATGRCRLTLPAEAARLEKDVVQLNALVATFPLPSEVSEPQVAAIKRLGLKTTIGKSLRDALYANLEIARLGRDSGLAIIARRDPAATAQLLRQLAAIERLPGLTDMPSADYRDFLYSRASLLFLAAPPGASFAALASARRAAMEQANAYGLPDAMSHYAYALALLTTGDCDGGVDQLRQARELRERWIAMSRATVEQHQITFPDEPEEFGGMIRLEKRLHDANARLSPEQCRTVRDSFASAQKAAFGWVD